MSVCSHYYIRSAIFIHLLTSLNIVFPFVFDCCCLGPRTGVSAAEQREIVNKHNELRRNVQPSASNMLKMVTCR